MSTRTRRRIEAALALGGINLRQMAAALTGWPRYLVQLARLRKQAAQSAHRLPFGKPWPCLADAGDGSPIAEHYFFQDLWVAQRIFANQPRHHVDVGSRLDGFIAHLAVFRQVEAFDIRPVAAVIPNVTFKQVDMQQPLDKAWAGYCDSLSCLHALEHFGLGRYGDPLDYDGHLQGLRNLTLLLQPGGKLYLSVPFGPSRIEFNAHRVFNLGYLLELLCQDYEIDRFAFVDDANYLHADVKITTESVRVNFGCWMGCAILEMTRKG